MSKINLKLLHFRGSNEKIKREYCVDKRPFCMNAYENSGFTLLEILVIVVIVGILAAIAAPGWVSFVNRQQVNKANDTVLAAVREAQMLAKKTKFSYSVTFRKNSQNKIEFVVYPTKKEDGTEVSASSLKTWKTLGSDEGMKLGQLLLGTNIISENLAGNSVSYNTSTTSTDLDKQKITFDYMGSLSNPNIGASGLRVVIAVPKPNSTQASNTKRCVIVQTLLGGIRTDKNSNCETSPF